MLNTFEDIAQEIGLLMREAISHIAGNDYTSAENALLRMEVMLAAIPNMSRSDTSIEYSNRVQDLLTRVRKLKAASRSRQVLKTEWTRPTLDT